jgi:hypothetical protein
VVVQEGEVGREEREVERRKYRWKHKKMQERKNQATQNGQKGIF